MPQKRLTTEQARELKQFAQEKEALEAHPHSPQCQFYMDSRDMQFYYKGKPIDKWEAFLIEPDYTKIKAGLSKVSCKPFDPKERLI